MCSVRWYHAGGVELSFAFLPEYWGQGLARESCATVIEWALRELDTTRLVAWTQVTNLRSRRLLTVLGMTVADRFTKYGHPQLLYAIAAGRR